MAQAWPLALRATLKFAMVLQSARKSLELLGSICEVLQNVVCNINRLERKPLSYHWTIPHYKHLILQQIFCGFANFAAGEKARAAQML